MTEGIALQTAYSSATCRAEQRQLCRGLQEKRLCLPQAVASMLHIEGITGGLRLAEQISSSSVWPAATAAAAAKQPTDAAPEMRRQGRYMVNQGAPDTLP